MGGHGMGGEADAWEIFQNMQRRIEEAERYQCVGLGGATPCVDLGWCRCGMDA